MTLLAIFLPSFSTFWCPRERTRINKFFHVNNCALASPKTAEQNEEIISYTIYANSSDRSFLKFLNVTGNTTTLAFSGLQPSYTDYLFMIQAVTAGGRGPYSHPVTNKTFEASKVFNKVNGILHRLQCLNLFLEPRGDLLLGVIIFFFFFLMETVLVFASDHRRTGRGGEGGCSPPKFWATQIFWAARENLGKASF